MCILFLFFFLVCFRSLGMGSNPVVSDFFFTQNESAVKSKSKNLISRSALAWTSTFTIFPAVSRRSYSSGCQLIAQFTALCSPPSHSSTLR